MKQSNETNRVSITRMMAKRLAEDYGPNWLFHPMWKSITVDSDAHLIGILRENAEIDATMLLLRYSGEEK